MAEGGGGSSSGGSGGAGGSSGSGGSGDGGGTQCLQDDSFHSDTCRSVESCCGSSQCWYTANGRRFDCDGTQCYEAADRVVDYCFSGASAHNDNEEDPLGCTTATTHKPQPLGLVFLLGLAGMFAWRRRLQMRDHLHLWSVLFLVLSGVVGCVPTGSDGNGSSEDLLSEGPPSEAERALNDLLRTQYPSGQEAGSNRMMDTQIDIASGAEGESGTYLPVSPGGMITPGIGYTSPQEPVDAICIGFGSPDNAWCVPVTDPTVAANGDGNSGAAVLPVQFPQELCGQLSQICHDIRCYEFARTSAGTFSAENINYLAFVCGQCDEPSCQQLLDSCGASQCTEDTDCDSGQQCVNGQCVGAGAFRFTLSWDSSNDLDLYVTTPTGAVLSYSSPSADSGSLDVDNTSGGPGSIENIFFTAPPDGTYSVSVNNFSGEASAYSIEVAKQGQVVTMDSGTVQEGAQSPSISVNWP